MEMTGIMIRELPEDERPRERLLSRGAESLSSRDLLTILIGSGTRNMSAATLADKLLALDKKGISHLSDCKPEEICSVRGIGKAKACQIIAAVELGKRIATTPVTKKVKASSPGEVAELFMEELRYLRKEVFYTLLLTRRNEIITIDKVAAGTLDSAVVHPREVFSNAVRRSASSVILIHNHPSGNPEPSSDDIALTKRLIEAGLLIGIEVQDHLIIGDGKFISMRYEGMM